MFKIYLHPETCATSKPASEIDFVGKSYPHYAEIRRRLADQIENNYQHLPLRIAKLEEFLSVHTQSYLSKLQSLSNGNKVEDLRLGMECTGLEYCFPGYQAGLGGMQQAIDEMAEGGLDAAYLFSLGGHHSYSDWGHGYCLLNPQAVAVRYAQKKGFKKVLIIDWDIHHGDGTQSIFENDPDVHCLSIHSGLDLYMSLMRVIRQGSSKVGKEMGHTNIPLIHQAYSDQDVKELKYQGVVYRAEQSLEAFRNTLNHLDFEPDLITIFCGYDAHKDDCGEEITNWDENIFETMTQTVMNYAITKKCPILSIHGGGYNIDSTISSAVRHVTTLSSHHLT
ncbi:MAG: histone deacetylase family protein [Anaerolineae bacterium]